MFLVSFWFFVFMAVSLALYYLAPGRFQWIVLLAVSFAFYALAGVPWTAVYLLSTVFVVWAGSNYIDRIRADVRRARRVLVLCLVLAAAPLAALKYSNFFLTNLRTVCGLFGRGQSIQTVNWTASLGVSFYTLQAIGYLLDVYWGTSAPQKNICKVALFTAYFPQMSSGPVSRYHQLEDQLYAPHAFDYRNFCFGLQRMLVGYVKKLVVAENIGIYTNYIFQDGANYGGIFLWLGMAAYLVQLYADFSGCMDIVLGASECFGVRLPENFDRPFHSRSIQEFWKRWHITLGAWVQDYIMYPILRSRLWNKMRRKLKVRFGKNAAKKLPAYLAMLILWFYMGLWHGGAWRYVMEGMWFGAVIISGQLLERPFEKIRAFLHIREESRWWHGFQSIRTAVIFGIGVFFFRASGVRQALHEIKACFSPACLAPGVFAAQLNVFLEPLARGDCLRALVSIAAGCIVMCTLFVFQAQGRSLYEWLAKRNIVLRWILLYAALFTVILFGVYGPGYDAAQFIYGGF